MSRRKKSHDEGHEGGHADERWLITYADMITLLMVLFIVLFAMSKVDQAKYISLASGLAGSFSETKPNITPGGTGVAQPFIPGQPMVQIAPPANPSLTPSGGKVPDPGKSSPGKGGTSSPDPAQGAVQAIDYENKSLGEAKRRIQAGLLKAGIKNGVIMSQDERGLTVTVINDLVFDADRADVLPAGQRLLRILAPILVSLGHKVRVEGHTNQVKVKPKFYPSEWELSSARASAVVRYLIGQGMAPDDMAAEGLADTQPLLPASDPRSVDQNRRVAIVVQSSITDAQRTLSQFATQSA